MSPLEALSSNITNAVRPHERDEARRDHQNPRNLSQGRHEALQLPTQDLKNTKRMYSIRQREWRDWCNKVGFDTGQLVSEEKLILFLKECVLQRAPRKRRRSQARDRKSQDGHGMLSLASIESYVSATVALYRLQYSMGQNRFENPRGPRLKNLIKNYATEDRQRREAKSKDQSLCCTRDAFRADGLEDIVRTCWAPESGAINTHEANLRTGTYILLSWHIPFGAENYRMVEFGDLSTISVPSIQGLTRSSCFTVLPNSSANPDGGRESMSCIRHQNVLRCGISQIAFYLLFRWNIIREPVPNFQRQQDWYTVKLFSPEKEANTRSLSYDSHNRWTNLVFDRAGQDTLKNKHAARVELAERGELFNVADAQLRVAERRDNDDTTESGLSHLPLDFVRASAGFNLGEDYDLPRANIEPPKALIRSLWPWVDEWLDWFQRNVGNGVDPAQQNHDAYKHIQLLDVSTESENRSGRSALSFLKLLDELRMVILQDSVLLREEFPSHPIWRDPLFARADYNEFAIQTCKSIRRFDILHHLRIEQTVPELRRQLHDLRESFEQISNHYQECSKELELSLTTNIETLFNVQRAAAAQWQRRRDHATNADLEQQTSRATGEHSSDPGASSTHEKATSTRSAQPPPLPYSMSRSNNSVHALWVEWTTGFGGGPPLRDLEAWYGAKWRSTSTEKMFFNRRKPIIQEIERRIKDLGENELDAIHGVERIRIQHKLSLQALGNFLKNGPRTTRQSGETVS